MFQQAFFQNGQAVLIQMNYVYFAEANDAGIGETVVFTKLAPVLVKVNFTDFKVKLKLAGVSFVAIKSNSGKEFIIDLSRVTFVRTDPKQIGKTEVTFDNGQAMVLDAPASTIISEKPSNVILSLG